MDVFFSEAFGQGLYLTPTLLHANALGEVTLSPQPHLYMEGAAPPLIRYENAGTQSYIHIRTPRQLIP